MSQPWRITPCPRLGDACRLYSWTDPSSHLFWVQHGDNEEHRSSFDPVALGLVFPISDALKDAIGSWVNSVHEYERQPVEVS